MDYQLESPEATYALKNVRRLVLSDRVIIDSMIYSQIEDLKTKGVNTDTYLNPIHGYLVNETDEKFLLGYFDNEGKLTSMMGFYAWKMMPFATLSFMFVRKSNSIFNSHNNGLNYCLHKCFETGESLGINSFYSLQRANSLKHKQRTWRKYDTSVTKKYYSVPELIIEPGTKPNYFSVWDMMDKQVWPYRTILWLTRKKPQYESIINWGAD